MFSNRIRISGLLLIISHCSQAFVLLTANIEDVKKIARKFVSEPMAQKIADFISKAAGQQTTLDVSEENEKNVKNVEGLSDNEIKKIQRQGSSTSKRYRTLTRKMKEKTTWLPKDYGGGLEPKLVNEVAKKKKHVLKQSPKSNSRHKPQSNSQTFLQKQIDQQLQQQIDKLQDLHKDSDTILDKLNQKPKRPLKRPQRKPLKHKKSKRPSAPSQNYQKYENSYNSDQQGYQSPHQGYRRPQQEYKIPHEEYKTTQQEYKNAQQDYKSVQQEYKTTQQEDRSPQQENKSAQQEFKTPQQENRSPQQENKSEQQEYKTPQQENKSPQQENKSAQQEYKTSQLEYKSPQQDNQNSEPGYQISSIIPQQTGNYQNQNHAYQTLKPNYGKPQKKKPKPYQPDYQSQVQQLENAYDAVTEKPKYEEKETTNQNLYTSEEKSRSPPPIMESDQTKNQELGPSALAKSSSGYVEQIYNIPITKHHRLRARQRERFALQDNDVPENQTVPTQPTMIIEFSSRYNGFNIEPKEALTTEKEKIEFDQYDNIQQHLVATAGPVGLKAVPAYPQSFFIQRVNSAPTLTSPPGLSSAVNMYPVNNTTKLN